MSATLFFGITLSSDLYKHWLNPKDFLVAKESLHPVTGLVSLTHAPSLLDEDTQEEDDFYSVKDTTYPVVPEAEAEGKVLDERAFDEAVQFIGDELYQLWNSYQFDDELSRLAKNHNLVSCKMGKISTTDEDERDTIYVSVLASSVSTNSIEKLGTMTPDPPEWKNAIDVAISLIEERLEQRVGYRIIIPTKGEFQWHLVLNDRF